MSEYAEHPNLPPAEHAGNDVSPRFIAVFLAGIGVTLMLVTLLVWWIYPRSMRDKVIAGRAVDFPQPELQPSPRLDMAQFFAQEMAYLHGTGWVDQAAGTVHIPIQQAMQKLARDGIPDWPTRAPPVGSTGAGPTPAAPAAVEGAP